jgi:uncharacterized protein
MRCRFLLFWLLGLAFAAQAKDCPPQAQPPTQAQIQEGLKAAKDRGALWRLEKNGRRSYLFGTIHVGQLNWAFPGPRLLAAMGQTDVLAVELDIADPLTVQALQQASRGSMALSTSEQAALDQQADAACLPRAALAPLHPIMQAVTYVGLSGRRRGLDPAYGQEAMLLGFAKAAQRPVIALETASQQIAMLLPSDPQEARKVFRLMLDSLARPDLPRQMQRMGQAWAQGDLALLADTERLCDCTLSDAERAFERQINDSRNGPMADRIAAEHAKGQSVLAAVGILHMTGPQALPKLMAERGFTVERVY